MRAQIKKYSPRAIYDNHLAAGLLLGFGIANCGGNHKKKAVSFFSIHISWYMNRVHYFLISVLFSFSGIESYERLYK